MAPKQGGELRDPPFKAVPLLKMNIGINLHASFAFFCKNEHKCVYFWPIMSNYTSSVSQICYISINTT